MKKRACVIQFPGSNCDDEAVRALNKASFETEKIFYTDGLDANAKYDLILIPGGFSYGDYLRTGVMAARSKIMNDVNRLVKKGVNVVGICNGFQILAECGLVDGVLIKNTCGHFVCKNVYVLNTQNSPTLKNFNKVSKMQIAHGEGCYYNTQDGLKKLQDEQMIAFYYSNKDALISDHDNPNGSLNSIAGVFGGVNKNVLGLMPHPERMIESGIDLAFFKSFLL
jgi:phosphoribosylformylglycinamidine synthase I